MAAEKGIFRETETGMDRIISEKIMSELRPEEKLFYHNLFIDYYKREYNPEDPEKFEFKLENLEEWLETQLHEKIGERCLISEKGFLSFSVVDGETEKPSNNKGKVLFSSSEPKYINIFQFVLQEEEGIMGSIPFLKELGKRYPNRVFRSAIRKTQRDKALMYRSMGCKVTDQVNLPGFSSDYYLGVEMPSRLIKTLSIFLPSMK